MENADNQIFEVSLKPEADPSFDEGTLDGFVDAINACDTVAYSDEEGWDITLDLEVEASDDFGDVGVLLFMDVTLDRSELDTPIAIGYTLRSFLVGTVTVGVSISDGLDDRTYETIPRDDALGEEWTAEMQARVTDLIEG